MGALQSNKPLFWKLKIKKIITSLVQTSFYQSVLESDFIQAKGEIELRQIKSSLQETCPNQGYFLYPWNLPSLKNHLDTPLIQPWAT